MMASVPSAAHTQHTHTHVVAWAWPHTTVKKRLAGHLKQIVLDRSSRLSLDDMLRDFDWKEGRKEGENVRNEEREGKPCGTAKTSSGVGPLLLYTRTRTTQCSPS